MRNHRGFTLIEILISLVVLGVVTGSLFMLITTTQRVSRAQSERATLQSNVRAGAIVIPSELRQINAVAGSVDPLQNDILAGTTLPTGTSITYRSMRGMSFLCQALAVAGTQMVIYGAPSWTGLRAPEAVRDAAYVFIENDPDASDDDVWMQVLITGVAAGNACPGAAASYTLTISPATAAATVNAPARTFEQMELGLYAVGGESWLGARSVSGGEAALQPILGPLTNADGLGFEFLDGTGAQTAVASQVKSVRVTLRGLTDQPVATGTTSKTSYVSDSLVTQVVLRNALR